MSEPGTSTPILEVTGLSASIGGYQILSGVDLRVEEGATVAVLGRNGVGKTTTLRTIMGFVSVEEGDIRFRGVSLVGLPTHEIAQLGIAYVPEDRGLFPYLTVEENLKVPKSTPEAWDYVFELFPALRDKIRQQASLLSGGQQQMLSIARALIQRPALLLLDEPCQGLAPLLINELVEQLRILRESVSIVVVEQNMRVARRLGEHVTILDDGKSVLHGPIDLLDSDAANVERYLGIAV